jgi:hypothetical protein
MKQVNFVPPSSLDFFHLRFYWADLYLAAKLVREIGFRCVCEVTVMFSVTT